MTNSLEVELRIPGTEAYSYANVRITSDDPDEMRAALNAMHELGNLSKLTLDQITGNVDKVAHDLVTQGLGATVQSVEPANAAPAPPWLAQVSAPATFIPPVTAPTQQQFVPPTQGFTPPQAAAPAADVWIIDVPKDRSELWAGPKGPDGKAVAGGGLRGWLNEQLKQRGYDVYSKVPGLKPIDWDGAAKRNTIKKSVPEDLLAAIRQNGITLS